MKQTAGKQIVMAEYQGRCDEKGTAVGHAPKVLEEYAGFLRPEYEARILAPRCVLEACGKSGRKDSGPTVMDADGNTAAPYRDEGA